MHFLSDKCSAKDYIYTMLKKWYDALDMEFYLQQEKCICSIS